MDVFKQLFEEDAAERSKHRSRVTDSRNAVQQWLGGGLDDIHKAAQKTGRMRLKQFQTLLGGTTEPVKLEGEVHDGNAYNTAIEFPFHIAWESKDSANVTVAAGGTIQKIPIETAIGVRPVDLLRDVLDAELSRRRPTI